VAVHPGDHLVAIPCFNHQKEVGEVVRGALRYVPADWIAVVDDGSVPPLQPADVCGALLLRHEQHRGLSAAIATAVRHALTIGADGLIKLDADGQMDTEALPCFRAALDEGYELVLGTFDPALTPSLELFADGLFRLLFRLGTGCSVPNVLADYRAYGPDALRVLGAETTTPPWALPLASSASSGRRRCSRSRYDG